MLLHLGCNWRGNRPVPPRKGPPGDATSLDSGTGPLVSPAASGGPAASRAWPRRPSSRPARARDRPGSGLVGDRHAGGEPGGELEAGRGRGDAHGAQHGPVMPFHRNRQRQPDRRGDVAHVHERAELPVRLPLRPGVGAPPLLGPAVVLRPPHHHRAQRHRRRPGPRGEAPAQVLGQALGQAVGTHGPAGMGVVDREVVRQPLTLGQPEDLRAGHVDHPLRTRGLGGQQHVPGAQHVDRHDPLRAPGRVVRRARARCTIAAQPSAARRTAAGSSRSSPSAQVEADHVMAPVLRRPATGPPTRPRCPVTRIRIPP